MPIFQKKYEKNATKESRYMMAVPLSGKSITSFNLYALVKNISVNSIHRQAVQDWIAVNVDEIQLLQELQDVIQRHWYHNQDRYANFKQFQNTVKIELNRAGLTLSLIEKITNKLKEA